MKDDSVVSTETSNDTVSNLRAKKAYHRPQILACEPLEAVAAACTPIPPAKGSFSACPGGLVSS